MTVSCIPTSEDSVVVFALEGVFCDVMSRFVCLICKGSIAGVAIETMVGSFMSYAIRFPYEGSTAVVAVPVVLRLVMLF